MAVKVSAMAKIVLPPARDFVFSLVLFCLAVITPNRLLADADTGWHVRAGDFVLTHHAFIRGDIFSYHRAGEPWFAWEWAADVVMALADRFAGLTGVMLLGAVIIAATFRRTLDVMVRRGDDLYSGLVLVLLAFGASIGHALARPHVVSWYLTIVVYSLLVERKRVWLSIPLTVLWVNLHGGFVFGCALVAITAICRRDKGLGLVCAGMAAASMISPYGYRLHEHIFEYLGNSHFMDTIAEFRSPSFHGPDGKSFIALLLVTIFALARSPQRATAEELAVVALCVYSALFAARGVPVASLLMALVAAPHLSALVRSDRSQRALLLQKELKSPLLLAVFVGGLAFLARTGRLRATFDPTLFPLARAERFLASRPDIDHLFLPDVYSGFVLYYRYPQIRTIMDDRHDFWGDAYVRDYQTLLFLRPGWQEALARMDTRFCLLPKSAALTSALSLADASRAWRVAFDDGDVVVFERSPH